MELFFNSRNDFLVKHDIILQLIYIANGGVDRYENEPILELNTENEVTMFIKMMCNFCQNVDYMQNSFEILDSQFYFVNPNNEKISVLSMCGKLPDYAVGGKIYNAAKESFYMQ